MRFYILAETKVEVILKITTRFSGGCKSVTTESQSSVNSGYDRHFATSFFNKKSVQHPNKVCSRGLRFFAACEGSRQPPKLSFTKLATFPVLSKNEQNGECGKSNE